MPTSMAWFRTGWQSQEDVCGTIGIFDLSMTSENAYARRFYIHDCFQLLVSWIILSKNAGLFHFRVRTF